MNAEKLVEAVRDEIHRHMDRDEAEPDYPDFERRAEAAARAALAEALPMLGDMIYEDVRGTNADLSRSPGHTYRMMLSAIRARFDALAKEVQANG